MRCVFPGCGLQYSTRNRAGQPTCVLHTLVAVASSGNYGSDPGHDDDTSDQ